MGCRKNFTLCLYYIFQRFKSFQVLRAYARYNGIVGRADIAQFGDVANVARAHFCYEHIKIFKIVAVYSKGNAYGRIVGAWR